MPTVSFVKKIPSINVQEKSNLMKALLAAQIPVASSCHGDGVCCKCKVQVLSGNENLSAPNQTELFLKEKFNLKPSERVSCQVEVLGPVSIDTTYW